MSVKKSNDTIGNRTRDLPACSVVPQPTALPRAPNRNEYQEYFLWSKGGRCVKLTTLPLYAPIVWKFCEPQPPGTPHVLSRAEYGFFYLLCIRRIFSSFGFNRQNYGSSGVHILKLCPKQYDFNLTPSEEES